MASSKKKPKLAIDEEQLTTIIRLEKHRVNQVECGRETKFQIFKRITVDEKETDYVICLSCNDWKLIKYDTKKGASNVNYHLLKPTHLNKPNNNDQPTINKFMIKSIPMSDRQRVYDKIALWCAQDNRPFNIVESEAFKAVVESIIQVTTKVGMVDVNELLPCKETVRNHSKKLYEDLRLKLINYLKSVDYINFTTDHWKDKMSGASYMTICIHYFNQKIMTLENRTIATIEVGNKCADTTAASFQNELIKLEVESKLRMVVTDNASSMIKAFNGIKWISCAGHNICLLQKYSFNDQENKDIPDPFPQLSKLIISAKALVKRVKKGNYNFDLLCRLKQECETRWDSMFDMLESISKNYSILVSEPSLRSFMDDIGAGLLQEVLEIIRPVKKLRTALSSDKNITLNSVSLTYLEIRKIMVPCAKDSPSIQILKKRFLKFLNGKFPISEHHIIATFLSPAYRSVPKEHCESKLVKDAMKLLHSYVDEIPERNRARNFYSIK